MTVLVDSAIWPWRGENWAHLVSDEKYEELHEFAETLGLRRMSFQGDHYDINSQLRETAIQNGAQPVDGRELVARLKSAGLRLPPSQRPGRWEELDAKRPKVFDEVINEIETDWDLVHTQMYKRSTELALVLECSGGIKLEDANKFPEIETRITNHNCRLELLTSVFD